MSPIAVIATLMVMRLNPVNTHTGANTAMNGLIILKTNVHQFNKRRLKLKNKQRDPVQLDIKVQLTAETIQKL